MAPAHRAILSGFAALPPYGSAAPQVQGRDLPYFAGHPNPLSEDSGLFDVGIVAVLGNLAQPDPYITISPEAVYGMHRFEECFAGDLFGYMFITGETPNVQIHIIEVCTVQLLEIRHSITSFTHKTSKDEKPYKLFSIIS